MNAWKVPLITAMLLLFCSNIAAIENPVTVQSVKAEIVITGNGEITGNLGSREAIFKVISFSETENQKVLSLDERLEINGKTIRGERGQDKYGNSYAVFKINETGRFTYRQEALIETNYALANLQEYDLSKKIEQHNEYTLPTEKVESNREAIRTIALNKFDSNSWLQTVRDVTEWAHNYLTYDLSYYPETYSAIETVENRRGTCDEFAILAASMLRVKEIPVRFVSGITYGQQQWANHAWIEAFNPESGWVPIDSTYGEAGIVDGTHFYMGAFPDPTDVADEISVPGGANATIGDKQVSVSVQETEQFSGILGIAAEDVSFKANQWFELSVIVRNRSNSSLIVPVFLAPVEGMVIQKEHKIILLEPLEEKEVKWNIRVNAQLQPGQIIKSTYTIISLNKKLKRKMEILPGQQTRGEAEIVLNSILPLVQGKNLVIETELHNLGPEPGKATVQMSNGATVSETVTVEAFQTKTVTITVENYSFQPYAVSLQGPGLDYSTVIRVHEGKAIATANKTGNSLIEQLSDMFKAGNLNSLETTLLIAILVGVVAIVFLLKELLTK